MNTDSALEGESSRNERKNKEKMEEVALMKTVPVQVRMLKEKLIVLHLNGLLVDVVKSHPKDYKPDAIISKKAVFKRPCCVEFLEFCFDKFEVGVWASREKQNVEQIVHHLMGDLRKKLLFCWDRSHCTETGLRSPENKHKFVVFKELTKLWEKHDPELPWEKGFFNESNTLLLEKYPYKASLNPPNSSIFPFPFSYQNKRDNSLADGGDLRDYLVGLSKAKDVQKYVAEHPIGQEAIGIGNPSWSFSRRAPVLSIAEPE